MGYPFNFSPSGETDEQETKDEMNVIAFRGKERGGERGVRENIGAGSALSRSVHPTATYAAFPNSPAP